MYNKRHSGDNDSDYYIARVEKDSKYYYEISDEAYDNDACNQLTNLHWLKVGKASDVHDGIVSSLRNRGCTFRRISVAPIEYSQRIYNELTDTCWKKSWHKKLSSTQTGGGFFSGKFQTSTIIGRIIGRRRVCSKRNCANASRMFSLIVNQSVTWSSLQRLRTWKTRLLASSMSCSDSRT